MFQPYGIDARIPANNYQNIEYLTHSLDEYLLDNRLSIYNANQYLINVAGYNTLGHKVVTFNTARLKSDKIEFISSASNFTEGEYSFSWTAEVGFICNATLVKNNKKGR